MQKSVDCTPSSSTTRSQVRTKP